MNALAKKLIQKFPECTRYTRQQLDTWKDLAWTLTTGHARDWLAVHATSWEPYEGIQAFIEKRPPDTKNVAGAGGGREIQRVPLGRQHPQMRELWGQRHSGKV